MILCSGAECLKVEARFVRKYLVVSLHFTIGSIDSRQAEAENALLGQMLVDEWEFNRKTHSFFYSLNVLITPGTFGSRCTS